MKRRDFLKLFAVGLPAVVIVGAVKPSTPKRFFEPMDFRKIGIAVEDIRFKWQFTQQVELITRKLAEQVMWRNL